MLKAIVFDFDGVIVDSEPLHYRAFLRVAEGFGVRFDYAQYVDRYIGYDDRDAFRVMLRGTTTLGDADDERRIAECCRLKADAFARVVAEGVEPIPGVLAFIERVAASLPVAIASGATRQDIDLILGPLDLLGRFDPIITADDVARSKPDPSCYRMAVQGLAKLHADRAITPGDCLSIEDTAAGISSARRAGLWTLGITTTGPAQTLAEAHRVINGFDGLSAEQLRAWFG